MIFKYKALVCLITAIGVAVSTILLVTATPIYGNKGTMAVQLCNNAATIKALFLSP